MLAGIGLNLGSIQAHHSHFAQAQLLGQLQDAHKRRPERGLVDHPKLADRRMIRMEIGAQITHRDVAVSRRFDRPGAKPTSGVTVDQQGQHHRRWILLAAGASVIDLELSRRDLLHRIQDEVNHMLFGHPIAQIAGQKHRRLAVPIDETCSHVDPIPAVPHSFKLFQNTFSP